MLIRPATVIDALPIAEVHAVAWKTTYQNLLPAEVIASLSVEQRQVSWGNH